MIDGYFQSAKYFDEQLVRRLFSPDPSMVGYLRGKYGAWLDSPGVTGISVRRGGDYLRIPDRHPFVGLGYFKKAISLFPAETKFIVCSDDIRWCRKHFRGERFLFVEGESVLAQLYVHVLCQNNILSNSSFSWWGGVAECPSGEEGDRPRRVVWNVDGLRHERPALGRRCQNKEPAVVWLVGQGRVQHSLPEAA